MAFVDRGNGAQPQAVPGSEPPSHAGRDALVQQIRSLSERNVRSVAVTRRDGSVSVARMPIIVGESRIQFCRNDVHTPTLVSLRIDDIASIGERRTGPVAAASAD